MDTNDIHYIEQVLSGNTAAFTVLVDRYKAMVFTLSIRMVKSREEAEEVAQDVFLKAYKSLNKFKREAKFSTWLYRITYNACLDHLKKHKNVLPTIEINDITAKEVKTVDNALSRMERQEYQAAIKNCLLQLPEDEGYIISLYYLEEQSITEIAQITNLSKSNVKVKLFRSRKKLFRILSAVIQTSGAFN